MSWLATGIGFVGSLAQGSQAKKAADRSADATAETAANAEALNRERFVDAQTLMNPYVGRSDIASRQLMAEMGLPQYQAPQPPQQYQAPQPPQQYQGVPQDAGAAYGGGFWGQVADATQQQPIDATPIPQATGEPGQEFPAAPIDMDRIQNLYGAQQVQQPRPLTDMERIQNLYAGSTNPDGMDWERGLSPYPQGQQPQQPQAPYSPYSPYMDATEQEYSPRSMSQIPGYQAVMDESLRAATLSNQMAGGTAYGGRRLAEAGKVGAGVQQSYYNNYMNMLQNMSSPPAATNLAGMGMGQAQSIGQQNIAATGMANDYRMQGTAASNAAIGDVMGGITNMFAGGMQGGYFNGGSSPQQVGLPINQSGNWIA